MKCNTISGLMCSCPQRCLHLSEDVRRWYCLWAFTFPVPGYTLSTRPCTKRPRRNISFPLSERYAYWWVLGCISLFAPSTPYSSSMPNWDVISPIGEDTTFAQAEPTCRWNRGEVHMNVGGALNWRVKTPWIIVVRFAKLTDHKTPDIASWAMYTQ